MPTVEPNRPLTVLGAAVPAALVAAVVDGAMAGAGLLHVVGLTLVAAFPVAILEAALAAGAPPWPVLRTQAGHGLSWFSGREGASRLLSAGTALVGLLLGLRAGLFWLVANHSHPGLITAAALAMLALGVLSAVGSVLPLATLWRYVLRLVGDPSPAAAIIVLGALLGGWVAHVSLAGPPAGPPDLRLLVILLAFVAAQIPAGMLLARLRQAAAFSCVLGGALLMLLLVPRSALGLGADRATLAAVAERSALSAQVIRVLRLSADRDLDGYSPLFGGGDCDDRDARVHPGASDPAGDGLDLDCSGKD